MYRRILAIGLVLIPAFPLVAADEWLKLKTPHFELFTTAGEKKGREAILYFEQVRSFFLQASPSKHAPEFPVRIVAFRSEKQYKPYRMNESALAYYAPSQNRDYIVMQDISGEHYPVAIHEYTHLVIGHSGLHLPVWLNEGWAELYSTLRPKGQQAMIGEMIPGRVHVLLSSKLLPLDVLAAVDHDSPLYNERDRAGLFYAESWALTHMLFLSPAYMSNFSKFALALSSGKSMADACSSVLGKPMAEVQGDLQQYLQSKRLYGALFDVKLEKSAEEADVSRASEFESGMVLADLLAASHKKDQAKSAYEELARTNPKQPEVEESLGYLAWQGGDSVEARRHFSRAFAAGTKNPQMCFHYAMLERQSGTEAANVIPPLRKAVELKPDYVDARIQLGINLLDHKDFKDALDQLNAISKVNEDQAQLFFSALAYANLQAGHSLDARKNAEEAKKWAKTPEQSEQAYSILRYLDEMDAARKAPAPTPVVIKSLPAAAGDSGPVSDPKPALRRQSADPPAALAPKEAPLSRAEGIAKRLDCDGKAARFTVQVNNAAMVFQILDPSKVALKHSGEATHDFTCGPQKPYHVVVEYEAQADAKTGIAGVVRSIEF
jgi:tetratricopeptide (TPR) repeat protein